MGFHITSILTLYFLLFVRCDDACNFAKSTLITRESIVDCLSNLPFNTTDEPSSLTINIIKQYFEGYAYRDTMLSPPSPFEKTSIDILKRLDEISATSFSNGLQFHQKIADTLGEMKDAHTSYEFPCSTLFAFVLPYHFKFEVSNENEIQHISVVATKSLQPAATQKFVKEKNIDITNKQIKHIKMDGIDDVKEEKPEVTISRWCEKYISFSRTPAARLNFGLQSLLTVRRPSQTILPEENIFVTVDDEYGQEQVVELPWYGWSMKDIKSSEEMLQMCPLISKSDNGAIESFKSKAEILNEAKERDYKSNFEQHDEYKISSNRKASFFIHFYQKLRKWLSLLRKVPNFVRDTIKYQRVLEGHSGDAVFCKVYKLLKKDRTFKRRITFDLDLSPDINTKRRIWLEQERDKVSNALYQEAANGSNRSKQNEEPEWIDEFIKDREFIMKVFGTSSDSQPEKSEQRSSRSLPSIKILSKGSNIVAFSVPAWRIVYLHIVTFSVSTDEQLSQWISDAVSAVEEAFAQKYKMVIDVRGNGGGLVMLGSLLTQVIFPGSFPVNAKMKYVNSSATHLLRPMNSADGYEWIVDYNTLKQIDDIGDLPMKEVKTEIPSFSQMNTDAHYIALENYSIHNDQLHKNLIHSQKNTYRSQLWSSSFSINFDRFWGYYKEDFLPASLLETQRIFTPSDVVIVSDGECGSTCAQFVKHAAQLHLAKVVGLGGSILDNEEINKCSNSMVNENKSIKKNEKIPFDVASFAAGSVIDSDSVQKDRIARKTQTYSRSSWHSIRTLPQQFIRNQTNSTLNKASNDIPSPFPRSGTILRYVMLTSYSFVKETSEKELEFLIIEPDEVFPLYPNPALFLSKEDYFSVIEVIRTNKIFQKCYDNWEVKDDSECNPAQIVAQSNNEQYDEDFSKCNFSKYNYSCAKQSTGAASSSNSVYGRKCTNGQWSTDCTFSHCNNGFYLSFDGSCADIPTVPPIPKPPKKKDPSVVTPVKSSHIGWIIGGAVGGVFVIVFLAFIILCYIRRRKHLEKERLLGNEDGQ
ncbi:uncharacterized protein MONOS_8676 [Monocercomonoides exilis]|uniref:uncharacterized protein n=1 Tax=Monocercomonoides exilis TaxID=2049356 RepID=UPI00355A4351|nr:hypothetical protein MONOS_8676 [Monocercomonoides exilis]|eukprot:MONOS_8676.1-p1 / transcript=MONOS_8676.1 / gene=MONOS_8676 / organism=Monocercomonoides_exilis_PA203 / gene_product=unspecified product / transcript_product=unspecified product / location=Mono_scaffold00333:53650-56825(+) / protein_length=1035 / sequence_SO=supercontig / SO=protein_coding / is_pseudo=false